MEQTIRASIEVAGDAAAILKQLREELLHHTRTLSIVLPLGEFSIPGKLAISKEITLKARLIEYSANMPDDLQIEFEPSPPSPLFPRFRGILSVRAATNDGRSILVMRGSYQTPLGVIGERFDAAIGSRIGVHSVEHLLTQIASLYATEPLAN